MPEDRAIFGEIKLPVVETRKLSLTSPPEIRFAWVSMVLQTPSILNFMRDRYRFISVGETEEDEGVAWDSLIGGSLKLLGLMETLGGVTAGFGETLGG